MEFIIITLLAIVIVLEIIAIAKSNKKETAEDEQKIDAYFQDMKMQQDALKTSVINTISEGQLRNQALIHENMTKQQP